jgi:hypothetical protein
MSTRAEEYRQLLEDVIAGGLLDPDEIAELKELVANAQRRMVAQQEAAE